MQRDGNAVKSPAQRLSRLEARREKLLSDIHRTRTRWEKLDKSAQRAMRALVKLERQLVRMDKTITKVKVEAANESIPQPVAAETDHLPEPQFEKLAEKMADEANDRLNGDKPKPKRKPRPVKGPLAEHFPMNRAADEEVRAKRAERMKAMGFHPTKR